jgi:fructokinase
MSAQHSKRPSIYGTGFIALDIVINADKNQPIRSMTGGTCGNVLTVLSFLGWDAYPIARLNGDVASLHVKADLQRWGVHLNFAECAPTSATPIVIQKIRRGKNGVPIHRFGWNCPHCGNWLPGFKPVTAKSIELIIPKIKAPKIFFMDRLSRAALSVAAHAAQKGAIVFFEPSAKLDARLLAEALKLVHVVKYADQRIPGLDGVEESDSTVQLEIQTLGDAGLRFRSHLPNARTNGWVGLPALPAPYLVDTCGAGDWCTAGLISQIGKRGYAGFQQLMPTNLHDSIRYGQALAAWACGFECARGGMYQSDKKTFDKQTRLILKGKLTNACLSSKLDSSSFQTEISCPACFCSS